MKKLLLAFIGLLALASIEAQTRESRIFARKDGSVVLGDLTKGDTVTYAYEVISGDSYGVSVNMSNITADSMYFDLGLAEDENGTSFASYGTTKDLPVDMSTVAAYQSYVSAKVPLPWIVIRIYALGDITATDVVTWKVYQKK